MLARRPFAELDIPDQGAWILTELTCDFANLMASAATSCALRKLYLLRTADNLSTHHMQHDLRHHYGCPRARISGTECSDSADRRT